MKVFLIKIFLYLSIVLASFFGILASADGTSDDNYLKLSSSKQKSLVVGTSRAAQGVNPSIVDKWCSSTLYNYAFNIGLSPYGPAYYESILKKLDTTQKNGLFIVCVDPWNISSVEKEVDNTTKFLENDRYLGSTENVNIRPNFGYLLNRFSGSFYTIIINRFRSSSYLHDNGWLEISVNMDTSEIKKRIQSKKIDYMKNSMVFRFSKARLGYLEKTIRIFKQHGKVYLVRLPVDTAIMNIENKYMPDFNEKIAKIIYISDGYLDFSPKNNDYRYTDGNHLYKASANKVSEEIGIWIKNH